MLTIVKTEKVQKTQRWAPLRFCPQRPACANRSARKRSAFTPSPRRQRSILPRRAVFGFFARPFCKKAASPCRSALLPAHCAFSVRRAQCPAARPIIIEYRLARPPPGPWWRRARLPATSSRRPNRSRARSGRCPHGCLPGRSNASARLPWPHCPRRETAAEW